MATGILLQDSKTPSKFTELRADYVTGAPAVVDNDHAYIHEGRAFTGSVTTDVATSTMNFLLTTPAITAARPYIHFRPLQVATTVPAVTISLFENSTLTSTDGTAVSLINRNRNSSYTAGTTLVRTTQSSTSTATTLIDSLFLGGGTAQGQTKSGDTISGAHEFVLKPNTAYPITVTGSSANAIGISFFLYEEDEG